MPFNNKATLYLLDYGDLIKFGHTTRIRQRFTTIDKQIEEILNLDESLVWLFSDREADFLENTLVRKYTPYRYGHSAYAHEILKKEAKDLLIKDIEIACEVFGLKYEIYKASDLVCRRNDQLQTSYFYSEQVEIRLKSKPPLLSSYMSRAY